MNKRQKEVIQHQLTMENIVLKELEHEYKEALKDINLKIQMYQSMPETQSRIYHKQYQETLKKQVEAALEKLHSDEYTTINQYLHDSYTDAFIGTMYDIHGQGTPVIAPIDQNAAIKAVMTDTRLNKPLYTKLGVDVNKLKRTVSSEISRGIAAGLAYAEIARNIQFRTNAPISRAKTIVRTEGHRIQQASAEDARQVAKSKGADVVKMWDATMDGETRPTHRRLDGQIRETDEKFEMDGKEAMYPGDFGDPAEDCNCRCVALTRSRSALDEDELATLKERAEFFKLDKSDSFKDFKKKYTKAAEEVAKNEVESVTVLPNSSKATATKATFDEVKSIKELEHEVEKITGKKINLSGTDLELMKKNMEHLVALGEEYGFRFDNITTTTGKAYLGDVKRTGRYAEEVSLLYPKKYYASREELLMALKRESALGNMPRIGGRFIDVYTTTHEFAHTFSEEATSRLYGRDVEFWDEIFDVYMDYKKRGGGILGKYASSNQNEFLAEAFADAKLNARPSEWSTQTLSIIDKYFKKKGKTPQTLENTGKSGIMKMGNAEVRKWYIDSVSRIRDEIDPSLPNVEKARKAFEARNRIRTEARNMMADEATRKKLDQEHPNKTFEELVKSKMERKGMTRMEAIKDVYMTATKTNANVNKELGLEDE